MTYPIHTIEHMPNGDEVHRMDYGPKQGCTTVVIKPIRRESETKRRHNREALQSALWAINDRLAADERAAG